MRGPLTWVLARAGLPVWLAGLLLWGCASPLLALPLPADAAPAAVASDTAVPAPAPATAAQVTADPSGRRLRVGLVLSGGGARGLSHVGVLKVLERERVPIDAIAGTSMGAIIGGLYASGLGAEALERELLALDWDALFATRIRRESLAQRRKEEDFEISPAIEVGIGRDSGEPMLPLSSVSSRGLELLLRRFTLPVRQARDFDALPIPFRAVATDMESGQAVVFRDGDLAQVLRASMSVPGVFPPTEVGGRILGDGGLVNNLPIDVARAMGVDVVIAVNIGTPLSGRDSLGTVVGLTAQMINILTEQNVQRSLATLRSGRDLLIAPDLGKLSSGDFNRARELVERGERHAAALREALRPLSLDAVAWQAHRDQRAAVLATSHPPAPITSMRFEGADISHPEHFAGILSSQPGRPFEVAAAERDSRALASTGDYLHADYRVEDLPAGTGLVYVLHEKPWGPNYFGLGLDLQSDFAGRGEFNIKLAHNRHWLNASGGEWRNRLQIGSVPRWYSEWYQPLGEQRSLRSDWFFSLAADVERRRMSAYADLAPGQSAQDLPMTGRYIRGKATLTSDFGQPWGRWGEWRLGAIAEALRIDPEILAGASEAGGPALTLHSREWGLRAGLVVDQLDHASFPRRGWRLKLQGVVGRRSLSTGDERQGEAAFRRIELDANSVHSLDRLTLDASLKFRQAHQQRSLGPAQYSLGGFHNLSGYQADQLSGNQILLGRAMVTMRLNQQPVLTRGFFAGATLEAGNARTEPGSVRLGELRWGTSLFLGADTGMGPLYFGVTWAPLGSAGLYLLLGRP